MRYSSMHYDCRCRAINLDLAPEPPPSFLTSINPLGTFEEWNKFLRPTDFMAYINRILYRDLHMVSLGYSILTKEVADGLVELLDCQRVIDLGCGSGYIASALIQRGLRDVTAVDNYSGKYLFKHDFRKRSFQALDNDAIIHADIVEYDLSSFDAIILSWPDFKKPTATMVAGRLRKGQTLIYQGSPDYTADEWFHALVNDPGEFRQFPELSFELNRYHVQFYGVTDTWNVYEKR